MLFRRFSQHVGEQNWFAVVIDFIVVVVGIFIGLQVTDWNQARLDRKIEARYLQAIQADLDSSAASVVQSLENYELLHANLVALTELDTDGVEAATAEELDRLIVSLWDLAALEFQMSAYEDMVSSVGASIVGSQELRQTLSRLVAKIDRYRLAERDLSQVQYRNLDNYLADHFPMRRFSRVFDRATGLPEPDDIQAPDYDAFIFSMKTQSRVTMKFMGVDNCLQRLSEVQEVIVALQKMIDRRLDDLPGRS